MGRPRLHDEDTRSALLDAAGELLAEHGAGALTLRRLAERVGASTQAIYSLFGSKEELVRTMHRAGFDTLDRHLAEVEDGDDPVEHLLAMALAYRRSALAGRHLYDVMFGCPIPEFAPSDEDQRLALGTLDRLRRAVVRHAETGAFGADDPEDLTLQIWALTHGLASLELRGALGTPNQAEQRWSGAVRALLRGFLTES